MLVLSVLLGVVFGGSWLGYAAAAAEDGRRAIIDRPQSDAGGSDHHRLPPRAADSGGRLGIPPGRALALYSSIVAPGTRILSVPLAMMRVVDKSVLRGAMARQLRTMGLLEKIGEEPDDGTAESIVGGAPTSLLEWCEREREAAAARADAELQVGGRHA